MPPHPILAYKNLGETPLDCLERTRKEYAPLQNMPMTYAGRLDPMAEGLMLILAGEACKEKEKYTGLDKTYEFEILVGFGTDTYDLLGLVAETREDFSRFGLRVAKPSPARQEIRGPEKSSLVEAIKMKLNTFTGTFSQKYPPFSSKTVDGKQLFEHAKGDTLPEELPEHTVTISKLSCTGTLVLTKAELEKEILRRIDVVNGDFRQEEIKKKWQEIFQESQQDTFEIISCVCECSSGTYIRQLVHDMGEMLGVPLVTYSIRRTTIGQYDLDSRN